MSEFAKFLAWSLRGMLAWLLILATLFFAMAYIGISNATTDASVTKLYLVGGTYATLSWSALAYTLIGQKEWLRWAGLIVPLTPVLALLASYAIEGLASAQ